MRRPLNWLVVVLSVVIVFVGMSLPGCGGGGGATGEDPPVVSGMLRQVRDAAELEDALKRAITQTVAPGVPEGPIAIPTVAAGDFSETYTVEAGVDELDVVRYDGTHLYVAPTFVDPVSRCRDPHPAHRCGQRHRHRGGLDPARRSATRAGHVRRGRSPVPGHQRSTTLVCTATSGTRCSSGAPSKVTVQVHDVRDPARPRKLMTATIDGVFVESRRIGDRVVLVSRHAPRAMLDEERLREPCATAARGAAARDHHRRAHQTVARSTPLLHRQ